jgi:hypothetical protein
VGDEAYVAYSGVTRLNRARAQARDPHTEYSVTILKLYLLYTLRIKRTLQELLPNKTREVLAFKDIVLRRFQSCNTVSFPFIIINIIRANILSFHPICATLLLATYLK